MIKRLHRLERERRQFPKRSNFCKNINTRFLRKYPAVKMNSTLLVILFCIKGTINHQNYSTFKILIHGQGAPLWKRYQDIIWINPWLWFSWIPTTYTATKISHGVTKLWRNCKDFFIFILGLNLIITMQVKGDWVVCSTFRISTARW